MKNPIVLFCCLLPFFLFGQNRSPYYHNVGEQVYVLASNGLNMRKEPVTGAEIVTKLPYGSALKILKNTAKLLEVEDFGVYVISDMWYEVSYGEKRGYVFGGYISRFPSYFAGSDYPSLNDYLSKNFTVGSGKEWLSHEASEPEDCYYTKYYKEGILQTINSCFDQIYESRYVFEYANLQEVTSLITSILNQSDVPFSTKYSDDGSLQAIVITQDYCMYTIQVLGVAGVVVVVECG